MPRWIICGKCDGKGILRAAALRREEEQRDSGAHDHEGRDGGGGDGVPHWHRERDEPWRGGGQGST